MKILQTDLDGVLIIKPEVFKERLRVYNEQTKPLIEFYGERLINIDGEGTPEPIFERVKEAIEKNNQ